MEVQDNNGEKNDGITAADESYQALIQAIKAKGGPTYSYTDIAPIHNNDGGAPGANIRVGYLYNADRVQLSDSVNGKKGSATEAVAYDASKDQLTYNPGRIDPTHPAFNASRKPLAAQFEFNGEKVIVIANHFNSKSGDQAPFGIAQPPALSSEFQRHQIAGVVNGFVKEVVTSNPNANVVVLGDFNDFQFTETASILKGNELDNLIDELPLEEQYTYTYDGNSQVLDHILVSKNLTAASEIDVVHLNADFPVSKGRVSDHDPVLAQIDLKPSAAEGFPLTILHTNDTHANLDTVNSPNNIARRVTAIKEAKAAAINPLLVDAGDVFSGTLYFNQYLGLADLEFMNLVQYDAMTFGNHEFDKGSEVLNDFIEQAEFPFVSSNVNFSADPLLRGKFKDEVTRDPLKGNVYPAIIMEVDGEQVGLIGLTTEDTANIASPGLVTFDHAVQKARETVAMLQLEGINKIIVLSHLGYDEDVKLAKQVEGIDIIVGGHSHTKLDQAVVDRTDNEPKLIVQTGEKGQFLGRLEVLFDDEGVLQSWDSNLISIDEKVNDQYVVQPDPEALNILNTKYKPGVEQLKQTEVGVTEVRLNGDRADVRTKETNLGNLIADGMLDAAQAAGTNAVIALQNGGGIREPIEAGTITMGDVMTVLPFNNDLVTITLTGQEIKDAMENGVSKTPAQDGRFPHIAGMKFFYDSTKPEGSRVLRIQVKGKNGYELLDLTKSYEVATNAFTAKGGDFYAPLEKAYSEGRVNLLYIPDYEVFSNYVKKVGTITGETSAVEGRIVDLKGAALPEEPGTPGNPGNPGNPENPGSPGPSTPPTNPSTPSNPGPGTPIPVEPGKVKVQAKVENGAATGDVTGAAMKEALKQPANGRVTIEVTSTQPFESSTITLDNEALRAWIAQNQARVLAVVTPYGSYELPQNAVNLQALAAQAGADASSLQLVIQIHLDAEALKLAASKGHRALQAVNYTVTVKSDNGKTLTLDTFNSYVKRTISLQPTERTSSLAVVRLDGPTGNVYTPVPFKVNGQGVDIYSRSNSTYLVLQHAVTFEDIASHWSKQDVESLAAKMIVSGRSEHAYVPNAPVTRAEFTALIVRALGLSSTTGAASFQDVASTDWHAGTIQAAVQAGIVNGYADGTFRPGQTITREEMASMLYKAMQFAGYDNRSSASERFADEERIASWAKEAVHTLRGLGIVNGDGQQRFVPKGNATRGESAAVLNRTIEILTYVK
ncbi:5'-nucleotidase C-terminal domain-containing protein [Paenibacillus sp. JCM 10914]|uniref:5'-nucleotidase C-terminal domain-containing protein n=1 Tax=Paenibacillus sp. JCM 10914 TaxID=1236974 RepID=UPI0003CCAE65|nr:5'-nucleotidase C-terminal domain-containing protein [Paenibacillus sp. JCM 10914]GAE05938.1 5'-nucleotidase [Paenibacillus sp. JCM 10914]